MTEFKRARSAEQKRERMLEIMNIADQLFQVHSYSEISLSTIAEAIGWSRGNLYKYVTTKEEIFLELYLDKQNSFFSDIKLNFNSTLILNDMEFSSIWAGTLDKHRDYLRYYGILATIIETNVTVERLAEFKKVVLSDFDSILQILSKHCQLNSSDAAASLYWTLLFHASGLNNSCHVTPVIEEAMKLAGLPELKIDFFQNFRDFMLMCLKHYKHEK